MEENQSFQKLYVAFEWEWLEIIEIPVGFFPIILYYISSFIMPLVVQADVDAMYNDVKQGPPSCGGPRVPVTSLPRANPDGSCPAGNAALCGK